MRIRAVSYDDRDLYVGIISRDRPRVIKGEVSIVYWHDLTSNLQCAAKIPRRGGQLTILREDFRLRPLLHPEEPFLYFKDLKRLDLSGNGLSRRKKALLRKHFGERVELKLTDG